MPNQDEFLQQQMDRQADALDEWNIKKAMMYVAAFKRTADKLMGSSGRYALGVEEIKEEGMDDIVYRFVMADNETKCGVEFLEAFSRITHEPPACVDPSEAAERLWLHLLEDVKNSREVDDA